MSDLEKIIPQKLMSTKVNSFKVSGTAELSEFCWTNEAHINAPSMSSLQSQHAFYSYLPETVDYETDLG